MLELVAFLLLGEYLEPLEMIELVAFLFLGVYLETPKNVRTSSFSFNWCTVGAESLYRNTCTSYFRHLELR